MQDSNFERLPRRSHLRQLGIHLGAIIALLAGAAANASTVTLTISGTPATTATVGTRYDFKPTVHEYAGRRVAFSVKNLPRWGWVSSATGELLGKPTASEVGTYSNIVISASDGHTTASLAPFSIHVTQSATSGTLTISGAPATTATVGSAYSFTPTVKKPTGDTVSFSIRNKPVWGSFSIASGRLFGTPTAAQAGAYSNIVISVSDGHASSSLAPFSILVGQSASGGGTSGGGTTGTAKLTWTAPTTNTNGSGLTDLAGYHIYYGNSPSAMTKVITVSSPATTSYTVSSLASGTWYFAVNAYTTSGVESSLSNTGSKTVP